MNHIDFGMKFALLLDTGTGDSWLRYGENIG